MSEPLRVLFVEDSDNDRLLLQRELERAGFIVDHERVETGEQMRSMLAERAWDLVISDYALPRFDALGAIEVYKQSGVNAPFIVCSGTIGEDTAVEVLKAGAHDFIVKDRLARFIPAVRRELGDAAMRLAKNHAEEAYRTAELRFRRIVETAQEGIWMVDAKGNTTYLNDRMAQMLAATAESLIGHALLERVDRDSKQAIQQKLLQRGTRESSTERIECKLWRRDGTSFLASVAMNAIDDDAGGQLGHLAMVVDITEQRALQEQLMVSDRMASLGTLAAGVAHEINNPLAVILANVHLAGEEVTRLASHYNEPTLGGDLQDELRDARDATRRLRDIVRDLKIFSRGREADRGPLDVWPVLESSLRMAWNEIRHRARVNREYQPVPAIEGNESQLGQVFLNLITNAVQAMDEGHADRNQLGIATRVDDRGRVVIEISDTGEGMSLDVQRRIFTPFFTTKPVGIGTGLGLTICRNIVHSLGGELSVESQLGVGSTFRVTLQAAQNAVAIPEAPPSAVRAPRRARILVVDDEIIIGSTVRRLLSTEHEVCTETSARSALAQIRNGDRFDLLLCDLMMPEITGMELYNELRKIVPDQARRMIFMTGGAFTPKSHLFLSQIGNPRLEKPFDAISLKNLINSQLVALSN